MILIAGCGFVGSALADRLHAAGHEVCGLTHSADSASVLASKKPWMVRACDISDETSVRTLAAELGETTVTALVHCASSGRGGAEAYQRVYVDGMRHLASAFPKAFAVFTSSTSVYAQTDGSNVTEESETHPPRETGQLLLQAETIALQAGGAVARLAGIYGPGRSFVLKNLLLGLSGVEGGDGVGRLINQIHRDDAASAVDWILSKSLSGIFNVVDDSPMTQSQCLHQLAEWFCLPPPGERTADSNRKRGWTNKAVSNHKLRATGWTPVYSCYFDAIRKDPELVPSILDEVWAEDASSFPRSPNILLIGLMGSGKTTVGRLIAKKLGWEFIDTDSVVVEQAGGVSIPEIFASEGEAGFRRRESAALLGLIGSRSCVIATGGGLILAARNRIVLRHLGFIVWLEAPPALLGRRTSFSQDRPLLQGSSAEEKLEALLEERKPLYKELADLRIQTAELRPEESAYGATESARVFFMEQLRRLGQRQNTTPLV